MIPKPQKQTILAMRQQGSSYTEILDLAKYLQQRSNFAFCSENLIFPVWENSATYSAISTLAESK